MFLDYHRPIVGDPENGLKLARAVGRAVRKHFPEATAVAGTGASGLLILLTAAKAARLPPIVVRKAGETSHMVGLCVGQEGVGHRVVLVDDCVSTGETLRRVRDTLAPEGVGQ